MSTLTREQPGSRPVPRAGTPPPRRSRLWLAAPLALLLAAGAVAYLLTRPDAHHYRIVFANAGQLVRGDLVRIGGTKAGTVDSVGLTGSGQAEIRVSIDDELGPLRESTTATIRAQGLIGVANRYVDVSPAPTFRPTLADGAVIQADQTTSIVEVDQLFNALDADTRRGLRGWINGSASWYAGKEAEANRSAQYFPATLQATSELFEQIGADSDTLSRFVVDAGKTLAAIDSRRPELTDLISSARDTTEALGADNAALSGALRDLPAALRTGSDTFARLRATLPDLQRLVDATGPAIRGLAPFLRDRLEPVLSRAVPTFGLLRQMFDRPGPNNDLYDALLDLPPLADRVTRDFPRAERALKESTPVFEFARPYVPDLVSWVTNFGGAFAPYDANGHYARTVPVFDAFDFDDDAQGGRLTPKPTERRGSGGELKTGFLRRCPGAATAVPDGSAPFVDAGPLANPNCDPAQRIGGSP